MRSSFLFSISLIFLGCFDSGDFRPEKLVDEDILRFENDREISIKADGVSEAELSVSIPIDASDSSEILLITSAGKFKQNGKDSIVVRPAVQQIGNEIKRLGSVNLISSVKVETATVQAMVDGFETREETQVSFIKVNPQRIQIDIDSFKILPAFGSEIKIIVALKREIGLPTMGSRIDITAITTDSIPIGSFRNINDLSDESGVTSFTYGIADSTYLGKITLIANSVDTTGLSDMQDIYVIKN